MQLAGLGLDIPVLGNNIRFTDTWLQLLDYNIIPVMKKAEILDTCVLL